MDGQQALATVGLPNPGGDPQALSQSAQSWQDLSTLLQQHSDQLTSLLSQSQQSWTGAGADAFHQRAQELPGKLSDSAQTASDVGTQQQAHAQTHSKVLEILEQLGIQIGATLAFIAAGTIFPWLLAAAEAELAVLAVQGGRVVEFLVDALSLLSRALSQAKTWLEALTKLAWTGERFTLGYGKLLADGIRDFSIDLLSNTTATAIEGKPLNAGQLFLSATVSLGVGGVLGGLENSGLKAVRDGAGDIVRGADGKPKFVTFSNQARNAVNKIGRKSPQPVSSGSRGAASGAASAPGREAGQQGLGGGGAAAGGQALGEGGTATATAARGLGDSGTATAGQGLAGFEDTVETASAGLTRDAEGLADQPATDLEGAGNGLATVSEGPSAVGTTAGHVGATEGDHLVAQAGDETPTALKNVRTESGGGLQHQATSGAEAAGASGAGRRDSSALTPGAARASPQTSQQYFNKLNQAQAAVKHEGLTGSQTEGKQLAQRASVANQTHDAAVARQGTARTASQNAAAVVRYRQAVVDQRSADLQQAGNQLGAARSELWGSQVNHDLANTSGDPAAISAAGREVKAAEDNHTLAQTNYDAAATELKNAQAAHSEAMVRQVSANNELANATSSATESAGLSAAADARYSAWQNLTDNLNEARQDVIENTTSSEQLAHAWQNNAFRQGYPTAFKDAAGESDALVPSAWEKLTSGGLGARVLKGFGSPKSWQEVVFYDGIKDGLKGALSGAGLDGLEVAEGEDVPGNIWRDMLLGTVGGSLRGMTNGKFANVIYPRDGLEEILWKSGTKSLDKFIRAKIETETDLPTDPYDPTVA